MFLFLERKSIFLSMNLFGIGGSIFTFGWIACPEWTASYSVPDANIGILLLVLDGKHSEVSKTVWMMSVSITELIWQAKTWEKSNQSVGHLRVVVFQNLANRIHIEIWMRLHFLGLLLDVNCLLKVEWGFSYKEGAHETCLSQWSGIVPRSHDARSRQSLLAFQWSFWRQEFYGWNIIDVLC